MGDRSSKVVVTGIGLVSPIGNGRDAFWAALCAGQSGIRDDGSGPTRLSAPATEFAARDHLRSPHLRRADGLSRMIAAAACMAVKDGGLRMDEIPPDRRGIVVGSAIGAVGDSVQYLEKLFTKGPALASPMTFPNLVLNAPASYAAMELGATGTNFTVGDGEISGEEAIALGCDTIRAGRSDIVIAGGGDNFVVDIVAETYGEARALAGQHGREAWCSPYDRDRSGIVLGAGAAMLLLESAAQAHRRGAQVYAAIDRTMQFSLPAPTFGWPQDQAQASTAARECLRLQGPGERVDLMVGSANGSPWLDACELAIADDVLASEHGLWVTSLKGAIGEHGAAGALSAAAACLALRHRIVPPLCNLRTPPVSQRLRFAAGQGQAAAIERALVLGIARGGAATALLLERWGE